MSRIAINHLLIEDSLLILIISSINQHVQTCIATGVFGCTRSSTISDRQAVREHCAST